MQCPNTFILLFEIFFLSLLRIDVTSFFLPVYYSSSLFSPYICALRVSVISTTVTFLILCPSLCILCRSSVPPRFAT
jgi:hypothetical protein